MCFKVTTQQKLILIKINKYLTEKAFLWNFFCIKKVPIPLPFLAEILRFAENFGSLRGVWDSKVFFFAKRKP